MPGFLKHAIWLDDIILFDDFLLLFSVTFYIESPSQTRAVLVPLFTYIIFYTIGQRKIFQLNFILKMTMFLQVFSQKTNISKAFPKRHMECKNNMVTSVLPHLVSRPYGNAFFSPSSFLNICKDSSPSTVKTF